MWISFHERFLTADNLIKRGIHITTPCILCGVNPETVAHIFLLCSFTLELRASKRDRLGLSSWPSSFASFWRDQRLSNIPRSEVNRWNCVINALIWAVWHERNQKIFQMKSSSIEELRGQSLSLVTSNLIFHYINVASHHSLLSSTTSWLLLFVLVAISTPLTPHFFSSSSYNFTCFIILIKLIRD